MDANLDREGEERRTTVRELYYSLGPGNRCWEWERVIGPRRRGPITKCRIVLLGERIP